MTRALAIAGLSLLLGGCALLLGLEDHDLAPGGVLPGDDGGPGSEEGGDGGDGAAGEGGTPPLVPPAQPCQTDDECKAPNGCFKGRCDQNEKVCVFDLCPQPVPCTAAACDTQTSTCGATTTPYGFLSASFAIPNTGLGCALDAKRCFAASFPYVFVGTTAGVEVREVSAFTSNAPRKVPIDGLDFVPDQIVISDRRVYFFKIEGVAVPFTLTLAYGDVPSDPTVPKLAVTKAKLKFPVAAVTAFPAPNKAVYLAAQDSQIKFPVFKLDPPIEDGAGVGIAPSGEKYLMYETPGVPAGNRFHTVTAGRLLSATWGGDAYGLALSSNPGTSAAATATAGSQDINPSCSGCEGISNMLFGSGIDGSVVAQLHVTGSASRGRWVIGNAQAASISADAFSFTENEGRALGVAWLNPTQALLVSGTTAPRMRVITRAGGVVAGRDKPLSGDVTTDSFAAAGTGGLGFVLRADTNGANILVHIADPRCQ